MRTGIVMLGTVLVMVGVAAAAAEPEAYDLSACIRAALKNDPDISAAAADVAAARARLAEAGAGRFGEAEYNQVLGFVNGATGDVRDPPKQNRNAILENLGPFTRLDLAINIPLWTFGKLHAALAAAQRGLESQQAGAALKHAEIVLDVKQLYYGLLLTQQLSGVLHDMFDNMEKAVKKADARLQAGARSVTELDVLKLRTGRAKLAKGVVEVDAAAALTRSALARAIGLPTQEPLEIADRKLQPVEATLAPLDDYLAESPDRRPETRQLMTGIAAQSAKVQLEEAQYYPSIFLATGFQYALANNRTQQSNPFAYDDFNYVRPVGAVGLHWDLNFLRTGAKVDQARADLERLLAQQRGAASGLQLEIRRAYSDVMQAKDTMTATEDGRKAGRSMLILTVSNFDLGIGEAEELFKGLGAYTEASTDYLRAVHDYNVAVATLSKAVGKEITSLEY